MGKAAKKISACEACGGNGVVIVGDAIRAVGSPPSVTIPCPDRCAAGIEAEQARNERMMRLSKMPARYAAMTFETFLKAMEGHAPDGKTLGYAATRMFAERGGQAFTIQEAMAAQGGERFTPMGDDFVNWLMLTGDYGVGKTGLAAACANDLVARNVGVLYMRVADMLEMLQSTYSKSYQGPSREQLLINFVTADVLILDEFQLENYTADRLELVEKIIRGRHGQGRSLLATTNIPDDEAFLKLWGGRIGDIVATSHWVGVDGVKLRNTGRGVMRF